VEDKQHNAITKWLMSCEVSVLTMIWVHLTKRVAARSSANTMVLSKKQIESLLSDETFVSGVNSMLYVHILKM
jgi:hypothetical protein